MNSPSHRPTLFYEAAGLTPDLGSVEVLLRHRLAAQRSGCELRLRHASEDLLALLAWLGLSDLLAAESESELGA